MVQLMFVEDDASVRSLLRAVFAKESYAIVDAINGQAALEHLGLGGAPAAGPLPDLIILDVMMPVMDGYTFATKLQADPATRGIPLVVLTSKGPAMQDLFSMLPAITAFVEKPFHPVKLREIVAGIIAQKR